MPKNGGPVIEFYHHFDRKINNKQHIGAASLSYYSNYWNTNTLKNENTPENLKVLFKELVKHLKKKSKKLKLTTRTYWVCKHALGEVQKGASLSHIDHSTLKQFLN